MAADKTIVSAKIHPGIGVARVGNSKSEFFVGPEVPHPTPAPLDYYKDATGALKRQAAKFRIYGYNAAGEVIGELNASNAEIVWTVHVANKKAAWFNFETAMDIPEATACVLRNAGVVGEKRSQLIIDPGPRSIKGEKGAPAQKFDTGEFFGTKVYLGELTTDELGNLIFLGGRGESNSPFPNNPPYTFANNDGWHDDTSDGPVSAEVRVKGKSIPVDPAWVVTAPPNYAPEIVSVQTMYDLLYDTYQKVWIKPVTKPSFTEHIFPILQQFCDAQWVNYGFHVQFGWRSPYDFLQPDYFDKLHRVVSNDGLPDLFHEVRLQLFNIFRDPASSALNVLAWPQMYGDAVTIPATGPRSLLALTTTQYQFLRLWASGQFEDDWPAGGPKYPGKLAEVELRDRPATLDKAALWFCLGGPFHPGCEMTWPMRRRTMYYAPFRVRPRAPNQSEPDYGTTLTPEVATGEFGPLYANGPGDLTRWMAVPWQTDTASCRAGYESGYDPFIPTFWPARVPNHVLTEEAYQQVMNKKLPLEKRVLAFNTRAVWYRFLLGGTLAQIKQMISDFGKLGVVERRAGPKDKLPVFPPDLYVESQTGFAQTVSAARNLRVGPAEKVTRQQNRRALAERAEGAMPRGIEDFANLANRAKWKTPADSL
ncbi:MAG TPA: LodA/GoxA family CTQ-dependent oxidase [Chthoniobacterales bacterium]|nr:LodA/GoxA family CTQ-dependent oxidase [Chthoniobacterales bacterium]